jgi:hypothetical protein
MICAVVLIIGFAPGISGAASGCERNLGPISKHASVFLHLDKRRYPLDGSIRLNAAIMNKGSKPVFLYGWISWGLGGGLVIWVRNEQGQIVRPVLLDDTLLPPPPDNNDPKMFVQLQEQGDFFGAHRDLEVADLVTVPGKYTMQIEYQSPVSCALFGPEVRNLPILWRKDGSVLSNRVPFEVVSQPGAASTRSEH